jgi:glutathione S-transferase
MDAIKVWGLSGPNPPKVAILLQELDIPYEIVDYPLSDVKKPEYIAINPNGRLPAIHDPNTGITLWESGAIIEYITDLYDPEHKLSFAPRTPEAWYAKQWLFFQTTGQGPYYGQAVWFNKFHKERLPSALDRYVKEAHRVMGVLEKRLAEEEQSNKDDLNGGPWLVGNKFSYADLAFIPWQLVLGLMVGEPGCSHDDFPKVKAWYEKICSRPAVKTVLENAFPFLKKS